MAICAPTLLVGALVAWPRSTTPAAGSQPAQTVAASDDFVVSSRSDVQGYHLLVARAERSWEWQPLATILPTSVAEPEP